ncbi:hypothetical protein EWB00_010535, partial [Schistosoma japonicum]
RSNVNALEAEEQALRAINLDDDSQDVNHVQVLKCLLYGEGQSNRLALDFGLESKKQALRLLISCSNIHWTTYIKSQLRKAIHIIVSRVPSVPFCSRRSSFFLILLLLSILG